jgi:hypothetical protein
MIVYSFELIDYVSGVRVMGTELDEPNPMIDEEFWDRFMQGDVTMLYLGCHAEEIK